MKSLSTLFALFFVLTLNAQNFSVENGSISHGKELRHAIHVKLEPEAKDVSKEFKSFMRSKLDLKLKGNWRERRAEGEMVPKLSDSTISMYIDFNESPSGTEFFVIMKYENGDYFTREANSNEFAFMEKTVNEFLRDYLPEYYSNLIDETNKEISKLEKSIKSSKKSISKNEKQIEKNQDKIRSLEDDIKERQRENEDLKKEQAQDENVNSDKKSKLQERRRNLESAKSELLKTKN